MTKKFDYTRNARRFVARSPVFTFVLTQVVFWVVAYVFLAIIAHMVLLIAGPALQIKINLSLNLVIAVFFGFFYGIVSGYVGWFFGRMFFYKKALWIVIICKGSHCAFHLCNIDQSGKVCSISLFIRKIF